MPVVDRGVSIVRLVVRLQRGTFEKRSLIDFRARYKSGFFPGGGWGTYPRFRLN